MRGKLVKVGQVNKGDIVHVTDGRKRKPFIVTEVLNKGEKEEEVLLDKKGNLYFIVSKALDGSSWAKDVEVFSTPQSI